MSDIQFINGLTFKAPHERAPEYVKAKGSIKRDELIATLQAMTGEWVNFDVKVSQGGKWYAAVDNWKPNAKRESVPPKPKPAQQAESGGFVDDDIPF